jgi:PTS system galactitol-specific IIA component
MPVLASELVRLHLQVSDYREAISILADLLESGGYVKETFKHAALAREEDYPTGLPTGDIAVAIPHADSVHVLRSAVGVGLLERPVVFHEMGNPESEIKVDIVIMLAIKEPKSVVPFLRNVCSIIQDQNFLTTLRACGRPEQVASLFGERFEALANPSGTEG